MTILSGGILESNLHRVISPPSLRDQAKFVRWSLVFSTRPGNSVVLRPLAEECPVITNAAAESPEGK
ncbi:uncharacterized protein C8Q71DRAFT_852146 [Rhodofomes roseus]|uniref:Isopenicillin N synthase-like Fe(2+) 2OG dioxygenase domain-containing protein n=1 Tax=Rhodofomes roseus TaxID=34475 RepID=A0ABQ8KXY3_9APHY|nr:uncharacterized protein C8Q71DRAFT_852146 [Rhodofomes roseus]KAH9843621.1 hypothetical protein C8Q71DRAFT_852146 [Rhodofomes roseus]